MAKKVSAVIYSDIHFNLWQQFWKANGTTRLEWTMKAHKEIMEVAGKYDVPTLFPGDMFHDPKKLGNELLAATLPHFYKYYSNLLDTQGQVEFGISGNHDQNKNNFKGNESNSYIKTLATLLDGYHCLDFKVKTYKNLKLFGIPYISHNLGFMEMVEEFSKKVSKKHINILMIHADLPKAVTSTGYEFEDVDNIPDNYYKAFKKFDLVLDGHIHKPTTKPLHKNIHIIGSPIQQNVGDSGTSMGYWLLYSDKTLKFVPLKGYPEFFYYKKGDEIDDFNYWVELPSNGGKSTNQVRHKDFTSINGRKKLVKKYMKSQGLDDNQKKKFLTKLLLDAESSIQ